MGKILKISQTNGYIIIGISVKDLAFVAENHPEYPMRVLDINAFGMQIVKDLESYATQNEKEKGCTHAEELFENILEQIGENGHDFIEIIELK